MSGFFRFSGRRRGQGFADALKRSFGAVRSFLPFLKDEDSEQTEADLLRRRGTDSAILLVLSDENGVAKEDKLDVFRQLIRDERPGDEVDEHIQSLRELQPLSAEETAAAIGTFQDGERDKLMYFLLSLAAAAETPESRIAELQRIFVMAGEDEKTFAECREETLRSEEKRRRIIGSGAGIAAALVVILVFIITATLLRSVIFGLILAYILLPLEKYFERRERKKNGVVYYFFMILSLPLLPLRKLAQRLTRRNSGDPEEMRQEQERRNERRIITKAVAQTALTVLVVICILVTLLTRLTAHYVGDFKKNRAGAIKAELASTETTSRRGGSGVAAGASGGYTLQSDSSYFSMSSGNPADASGRPEDDRDKKSRSAVEENFSRFVSWLEKRIGRFRAELERIPLVRVILDQAIMFLKSEESQKELLETLLKNSGGVLSFTAKFFGTVVTLLIDLLLTVFFALLFLVKLAEFCRDDDSSGRKSEYLVRTVFNGNWLPGTNEVTLNEAKRILGGIMERLRVWARGYLTLVCVDTTVYTTVFFFLRVPYFPVLGIIAGCGILLPYLGPMISAILTLLVTLAVGNCTGLQLIGILAAYLIYNGIIEQFILYPAVIGEALGLTTLETIVVVLLGAIVAGIPGMILALPAASVLKYLIPQIIQYLHLRKSARDEAAAEEEETGEEVPK